MNSGDGVLRWNSAELQSAGQLVLKQGQYKFLKSIDRLNIVSHAISFMAEGYYANSQQINYKESGPLRDDIEPEIKARLLRQLQYNRFKQKMKF